MEDSQTGWMERRAFALTDSGQRPHSDLASWSPSPNLFFDFRSFFFFKLFSLFLFCPLSWEWQQGIQFVTLTVCPVASSVTPTPTINSLSLSLRLCRVLQVPVLPKPQHHFNAIGYYCRDLGCGRFSGFLYSLPPVPSWILTQSL